MPVQSILVSEVDLQMEDELVAQPVSTASKDPDKLCDLPFHKAAPIWLSTRSRQLEKVTFYGYERIIIHLNKYFGGKVLRNIHLGDLRRYQRMRQENHCEHNFPTGTGCHHGCSSGLWKRPGGASCVNHELNVMQQVLKRAGLWEKFADHFEVVPAPHTQPPKVMSLAEEKKFFAIADSNPDWQFAGMIAKLTANTTASGKELRSLRLRDIKLESDPPRFFIPEGKNSFRERTIPLNQTAADVMKQLLERAHSLGSIKPDHYVFPLRFKRGGYDPSRPASASWLRHAWHELREAAGLPWLTPHCLRHQAITTMAEHGIPPEIIRSTAGHVSEQMMRHYCHTRLEVAADYLSVIDPNNRFRTVSRPKVVPRKASPIPHAQAPAAVASLSQTSTPRISHWAPVVTATF